jgi:hypothetical protein
MITTSLDGLWATVRRGREVTLLERGAPPAVGQLTLESDDVDVAMVGTPSGLLVVSREPEAKVMLYQAPYLDAGARIDLEVPMKLVAVTGPRAVLVSLDGKRVQILRTAQRALATAPLDVGSPVEFAVGLERNQVLFSLLRKLEVWDAVSGRPLLRLQLQLPPPPRTVGAAQGHLWAIRSGSDEVFVYRLSDGRPFRHHVGTPIEDVICHPASPLLVLVTPRGLVRLHCFAHSLTVIDSPWTPGTALAQIGVGDDISLIGTKGADDPFTWRVPIAGAGAPIASTDTGAAEPATAADRLRETRERAGASGAAFHADALGAPAASPAPQTPAVAMPRARVWRDPLAAFGLEIARGTDSEMPIVAVDTELGELAHRLHLQSPARRALVALYALYLVGEPAISLARLAHVLGDWTEPLGQGDLNALAMLRRKDGKVALRSSVTELLDGVSPRAIRVVGGAPGAPRTGATRVLREGRSDATIEADLASQLGRIAVIEGAAAPGLLEARMYCATAVALAAPYARPQPWPREAGLVVVADGGAPPWVAALPALT